MKKRTLKNVCLALMALALVCCASAAYAAGKGKIANMQIMTGGAGGTWAVIGAAISEKVNLEYDGFPFTAAPSPGSVANPMIVSGGESAFGLSYPTFLVAAMKGEAPYDKPASNLRAIAALPITVVHMFVDSGKVPANSVQEMLDKKMVFKLGIMPQGAGSYMIFDSIFKAYGLKKVEEIKGWGSTIFYATGSGLSDAWKDLIIDVSVGTYNIPASIMSEAMSSRKGRILNMGEELMPKLLEIGFTPYVLPKGTYANQDYDVATVGLPMILFTRENINEDIVYTLTKTIYENDGYLKNVHSSFQVFERDKMHMGNGIELHAGAVKFYKEIGLM